jgi:uncharacterized protein
MLAGYLIPFGNILGPLIIWLMKKDEDDFVARHALEAMNFQISVLLAVLLCIPLVFVIVGLPLLIVICIGQLVLGIIACIAAMSGEEYRYPYSFRFVNG